MGSVDVLDLWLDGQLAGKLMRSRTGEVEFSYDESYAAQRGATQLSLSMPVSWLHHGPEQVAPWLSNLLPDAQEVRVRWAAKFHETQHDPFTLLRHMGQDAQGSVQVVPEGVEPNNAGSLSEQSNELIAARIEGIVNDPDHWVDYTDDDAGRFSLGGNQGKFALARIDDRWFEPNGRAASTHIVKPGMATTSGSTSAEAQAVEFVTMRASRSFGIPTAKVDILEFAGVPGFVTERYDRIVNDGSTVRRLHQEDFCQALSVLPSQKYEEDGGPTMGDMVSLIRAGVTAQFRTSDLETLTRLIAFNLLVAGVDAHAKNHSVVLFGGRVRLAPAYDLISAFGLWDESRVKYQASAAVKYGKERRYRNISGRNLARTADVLGVQRAEFRSLLHEMRTQVRDSFDQAVAELPTELVTERVREMPERIERFARDLDSRVTSRDISETPQYEAPTTRGFHLASARRVWVPGKLQRGRWETGHYRRRPRSEASGEDIPSRMTRVEWRAPRDSNPRPSDP